MVQNLILRWVYNSKHPVEEGKTYFAIESYFKNDF